MQPNMSMRFITVVSILRGRILTRYAGGASVEKKCRPRLSFKATSSTAQFRFFQCSFCKSDAEGSQAQLCLPSTCLLVQANHAVQFIEVGRLSANYAAPVWDRLP
jgi:hypothetical protein